MTPRGAQKGNTNALKHGFYSKQFRKSEIDGLDALKSAGLQDLASEIAILRVSILRAFEQISVSGEMDWVSYLDAIGRAATRLASVLRTQRILEGEQDSIVVETLKQTISEIADKEWK